jgi:hypothetical protein
MARRTRPGIDVLVLVRGVWWSCGRENDGDCQKQRTENEPNPHPDELPRVTNIHGPSNYLCALETFSKTTPCGGMDAL